MTLLMDERKGHDSASAQPALVIEVTPFTKHGWQMLESQLEPILNKGELMTQKISVEIMPGSREVVMTDQFTRYSLVIAC